MALVSSAGSSIPVPRQLIAAPTTSSGASPARNITAKPAAQIAKTAGSIGSGERFSRANVIAPATVAALAIAVARPITPEFSTPRSSSRYGAQDRQTAARHQQGHAQQVRRARHGDGRRSGVVDRGGGRGRGHGTGHGDSKNGVGSGHACHGRRRRRTACCRWPYEDDWSGQRRAGRHDYEPSSPRRPSSERSESRIHIIHAVDELLPAYRTWTARDSPSPRRTSPRH